MAEILFVRHAQTAMAGTFCGHSDPPLEPIGYDQVQSLLQNLSPGDFDVIYTSDLQRASRTAAVIAGHLCLPMTQLPALREIDFGSWEGLTWNRIESSDPVYAARWLAEFPNLPAPGGEVFVNFESRILQAFDRLVLTNAGKRLLVVTHAGVMRVILTNRCHVSDADAWQHTQAYCSSFRYPVAGEVQS